MTGTNRTLKIRTLLFILGFSLATTVCAAQEKSAEDKLRDLQDQQDEMQKVIDDLRKEIDEFKLEPKPVVRSVPSVDRANVRRRATIEDRQTSAPRLNDRTLDPEFRGFIPVPNTPVLLKFNALPRLDVTGLSKDGDEDRFVTAKIPTREDRAAGSRAYDSRNESNLNARASALTFEAVAPGVAGNPRFFYKNDFFGSTGAEFDFRVQHFYGQYYNFIVGQTFSVFEDPDVWPDTVDFEGPNAIVFARFPVLQYQFGLADNVTMKVSVEQPNSEVDTDPTVDPDVSEFQQLPDFGFNVRWEDEKFGHVQFSNIVRYIGADSSVFGKDTVTGWGVNLSAVIHVTESDTLLGQVVYGEGIGRYGNDTSFFHLDAAFDSSGDLEALEYFSIWGGISHRWSEKWRSTATYGWVNIGNEPTQPLTAYDKTQYVTANVVYQMFAKLAIGAEVQYGTKEARTGRGGDLFGAQVSFRYSIF